MYRQGLFCHWQSGGGEGNVSEGRREAFQDLKLALCTVEMK